MKRWLAILLIAFGFCLAQDGGRSRWKGLEFLFGDWAGAGRGQPGARSGDYSFLPDLQGQVVVRRSFNQLANGPRHEDLLVIYADGSGGAQRGMYFDSEGHVIRYKVSSPGPDRAVFESEGEGPRYRLTYWMAGKILKGTFEVGDKIYLQWDSVRKEKAE